MKSNDVVTFVKSYFKSTFALQRIDNKNLLKKTKIRSTRAIRVFFRNLHQTRYNTTG